MVHDTLRVAEICKSQSPLVSYDCPADHLPSAFSHISQAKRKANDTARRIIAVPPLVLVCTDWQQATRQGSFCKIKESVVARNETSGATIVSPWQSCQKTGFMKTAAGDPGSRGERLWRPIWNLRVERAM